MVAGRDTRKTARLIAAGLGLLACAGSLAAVEAEPAVDPALRAALRQAVARSDSFADRYDAEVWLTDFGARLAPWVPDAERRMELLRLVHREASAADLPPELVMALIEIESAFDPYAISSAGARGLMQVMPFWKKELGRPDDNLLDPQTNLRYGCTILRHYLDREKGDIWRALSRYNGRLGTNPYGGKVLDALNRRWFRQ